MDPCLIQRCRILKKFRKQPYLETGDVSILYYKRKQQRLVLVKEQENVGLLHVREAGRLALHHHCPRHSFPTFFKPSVEAVNRIPPNYKI